MHKSIGIAGALRVLHFAGLPGISRSCPVTAPRRWQK
ncbi:Uncharacterized protein pbN1_21940 [Aromatoleum bremense]|nr:Uncharacterized protein pbN1_21940 [Aromatoleum bremense]